MPNMFGAMASGIKKGLQAPGKALMKAPGMKTLAKPMNTAMRATPGLGKLPGAMGMGAPTQGLGPSPQMTPPPMNPPTQVTPMPPVPSGQDMQLDQSMMQNPDMSQMQQPDVMQNQVMPQMNPQMNPQMQPEPQMMKMFGQSFPRPQVQPRQSAMSRKIQTARGIGPSMG